MRFQLGRAQSRAIGTVVCILACLASRASAQTKAKWLTATTGDWTDPIKWSTNPAYPQNDQPNIGDSYDAVIDAVGADYAVNLAFPITLNSLTLNSFNATLVHNGSGLTLLNGGTVSSGTYQFVGGNIAGPGPLNIAAGGLFSLPTPTAARTISTMVNNSGVMSLTNGGVTLSGGTISNQSSGVFYVSGNGFFSNSGAGGTIINAGTLIWNSQSLGFPTPFINSGTVTSYTLLQLSSCTLNSGTVFDGPGTIVLNDSNIMVNGNVQIAANTSIGGTMSGDGEIDITSGTTTWGGGTIGGAATSKITVAPGATLNLAGNSGTGRVLTRTLNNSGVVSLSAGTLGLGSGVFNNLAGGVFYLSTENGITLGAGTTNGPVITNAGTIIAPRSATLIVIGNTVSPISNSGTLLATAGSTMIAAGTTFLDGSVLTGAGTISLSGVATFNANATFSAGTVFLNNASVRGSGNLNITSGVLNWNSGTLAGSGAINLSPGAVLLSGGTNSGTLSRPINNSGSISWTAAAIRLASGTLNNLAGGVINVTGNGSLSGTFGGNTTGTSGFSNAGTALFAAAGTSTIVATATNMASWSNSGTLLALGSGTVTFSGGQFNHNSGAYIGGDATVIFGSGTHNLAGALTLGGSNIFFRSGSFPNAGTFTGIGTINVAGNFHWESGDINGPGAINVLPAGQLFMGTNFSSLFVPRSLNNSGYVRATLSQLQLNATTFTNGAGATFDLVAPGSTQISGGTLSNFGTINISASSTATLNLTSVFTRLFNYGTISANTGTVSVQSSIGGYFTGPGTFQFVNGGTLTSDLTLAAAHVYWLDSVSGVGDVQVKKDLFWSSGTFGGVGQLNILSGATLTAAGGGVLARTLNNSGLANITSGSFGIATATFNNLAGGVVYLSAGSIANLAANPGSAIFNNAGLLEVSPTGTGSCTLFLNFINSGTTAIDSGTLVLSSSVSNVAATHLSGSTFTGPGTLDLRQDQIVNGNLTLACARTVLNNATIGGPGQVLLSSSFDWNGGDIAGPGTFIIAHGGILNVANSTTEFLEGPLNNSGTVNLSSGTVMDSGQINNLADGVFSISASATFVGLGSNAFSNAGTLIASAGSINFALPLNNTGTVLVRGQGTLNFTQPVVQVAGTTLTGGNWIVDLDGQLNLPAGGSLTVNQANVSLNTPLATFPQLATLQDNQGALSFRMGKSYTTAGSFNNSGVVNIDSGGALILGGPLTNSGTINGTVVGNGPSIVLTGSQASISSIQSDSADVSAAVAAVASVGHIVAHSLDIAAGATLKITGAGASANIVNSLSIENTGVLDLANNSLVIDYTGPTPVDAVRQLLRDGKLVSTTPGPFNSIGYADDGARVLIDITYAGDSNLDGKVDVTDLGALATNWQTSSVWSGGDFNYDGFVDVTDLGLLATNWQAGVGSPLGLSFNDALTSVGLGGVRVPEPAGAGATVILLAFLSRRRPIR